MEATATAAAPARPQPRTVGRRVVLAGVGLVALQLGFRAWAAFGSWFQFDDFAFLSRAYNSDLTWAYLTEAYGGHLMPGGFLLTWLFAHHDPLGYWPYAATLLLLQAVASLGFLRLLVHMFGRIPAILPLLALYLFSVISLPAFVWWAAGMNQLPLQIALFFGLASHVSYLRTRRVRHVFATLAWTAFGLLFYEKTLLVFLAYGIVAFAYFATGPVEARVKQLWSSYRAGLLLHGSAAIGYLAVYFATSLTFDVNNANETPIFPLAYRVIFKAFATGVIGGPFQWTNIHPIGRVADPSDITVFVSWLAIGYVVFLAYQSRVNSLRAWSLTAGFLLADVVLLTAGRAFLVGPLIGLEYRYQTEMSAVFALSVGLAFLPVLGATDTVRPREALMLPFRPEAAVVGVTLAFIAAATISNLQYVTHWHSATPGRPYFANVERSLAKRAEPVPLADLAVPQTIMWGFRYPENTYSHVFRLYDDKTRYPSVTNDNLFAFDDKGVLRPAAITSARVARPHSGCGYDLRGPSVSIPLNGPVTGRGWWVRLGYFARSGGAVTVTAGQEVHLARVEQGLHSLYFEASGDFDTIRLSASSPGVRLCATEVTLGLPKPFVKP